MSKDVKGKRPRINQKIRRVFHGPLSAWYRSQARDLPWRRTQDPYSITVSELMLQQTQVVTVIPYYHRWLKQFPTWEALAKASENDTLKAWEGLGYYSRVRNLKKLAHQVIERGGNLPEDPGELTKLSGIGPYTAGALASLAFGKKAALVDGNVMRVFARVFNWSEAITDRSTQQAMWEVARNLLPEGKHCAVHNSALMELGAMVCTPNKPLCSSCPLQTICQAIDPEKLPVKSRTLTEKKNERVALISKNGRWWLEPGPTQGRLAGFWRFPEFDRKKMKLGDLAAEFTYGITRFRVRLRAHLARWKSPAVNNGKWYSTEEMERIPLSAAHGRLRKLILTQQPVSPQIS